MKMFYTSEDIDEMYGIQTKMLVNWRANLIGPDCIKWKDKILYHSEEIEEWFEVQETEAEAESEDHLKTESGAKPEPEKKVKPDTTPHPEKKIEPYTKIVRLFLVFAEKGPVYCLTEL